jgi:hypothetical protein
VEETVDRLGERTSVVALDLAGHHPATRTHPSLQTRRVGTESDTVACHLNHKRATPFATFWANRATLTG